MVLLDVDRLPEAMSASRLTSYNRWNWAAFGPRSHRRSAAPLRRRLATAPPRPARRARQADPAADAPRRRIHLQPDLDLLLRPGRGSAGGDGRRAQHLRRPDAVLAAPRIVSPPRGFRAVADKSLFVSPFMAPSVRYEFLLSPPGPSLVARMNVSRIDRDPAAPRLFDATLTLRRQPWTARTVRRTLLRFRG